MLHAGGPPLWERGSHLWTSCLHCQHIHFQNSNPKLTHAYDIINALSVII